MADNLTSITNSELKEDKVGQQNVRAFVSCDEGNASSSSSFAG